MYRASIILIFLVLFVQIGFSQSNMDIANKYYTVQLDYAVSYATGLQSCVRTNMECRKYTFYTQRQFDSIKTIYPKFLVSKISESNRKLLIDTCIDDAHPKALPHASNNIGKPKRGNIKYMQDGEVIRNCIDTVIKYYLPSKPQKQGYAMTTKGCKTISFNTLPPTFFTQTQYDSIKKINPKFSPSPISTYKNGGLKIGGNRTSNTTYCPDGLLVALSKDDESQIKRINNASSIPVCGIKSIEIDSLSNAISKTQKITPTSICQAAPIIPKESIHKDSFLNGRKYQPKTGKGITLGGNRTQTIDFQVISATDTIKQTFDVYKLNTWVDSLEKVNIKVVGNSRDTIKRFCFDGSMYQLCRIHFGDTIRLVYNAHTLSQSMYQAKSNNSIKIMGGRPTVCDLQFYDDKGKPISIQEYEAIQRKKNRWYRKLFRK